MYCLCIDISVYQVPPESFKNLDPLQLVIISRGESPLHDPHHHLSIGMLLKLLSHPFAGLGWFVFGGCYKVWLHIADHAFEQDIFSWDWAIHQVHWMAVGKVVAYAQFCCCQPDTAYERAYVDYCLPICGLRGMKMERLKIN